VRRGSPWKRSPGTAGNAVVGSPARSWALVAAGVVALLVILSTSGPNTLPSTLALEGASVWAVRIIGVGLALAGLTVLRPELLAALPVRRLGLLAHLLPTGSESHRGPPRRRAGSTMRTVRTAAVTMGVLAVVALLTRPAPPREDAGPRGPAVSLGWLDVGRPGGGGAEQPSNTRGGSSPLQGRRPQGGREPTPVQGTQAPSEASDGGPLGRLSRSIGPYLGPLLFIMLVAALISRLFARRAEGIVRPEFNLDEPGTPRLSFAALEESLEKVAAEHGDPQDQITAAYHVLLRALATAGAERRPEEGPHEHLFRALGPLGVQPAPLHHLTGLYVLAQFGERAVTDAHRTQAADALRTSLAMLREEHGRREATA
jgi:hypothetical protein